MSDIAFDACNIRINWHEDKGFCNWKRYVGSNVRTIWHTLDNDQKIAVARDAYKCAQEAEYS